MHMVFFSKRENMKLFYQKGLYFFIMKHGKKLFLLSLLLLLLTCSGVTVHAKSDVFLVLHKANGRIFAKYPIDTSGWQRLPSARNPKGYTFLGWSEKKGQTKNPHYLPGQKIHVRKTTHLYAVLFDRRHEPDLTEYKMPTVNPRKFSRVIFVGDSRTVKMRATLQQQCSDEFLEPLSFVCKSGQGLDWFKEEGLPQLKHLIRNEGIPSRRKPIAIVFNLGVNDLRHLHGNTSRCDEVVREYAAYMNRLAKHFSSNNCKFYYMSVNPLNSAMNPLRKEKDIRYFNAELQKSLSSKFQFLDVHSRLLKYGYSTNNDVYGCMEDDGLHYSMRTYKRIYTMCMNEIMCLK